MEGRMFLIGHSNGRSYLIVQELLEGGQLGNETYTETSADFDQVVPFTCDGKTYIFTFNSSQKRWTLREQRPNGYTLTDVGAWKNAYKHIVINVMGEPILYAHNQSSRY